MSLSLHGGDTMRRDRDDTDLLARELLAIGTSQIPDQTEIDAVRRQLDAVRDVLRFDAQHAPSEAAIRRAEAIFQPRVAPASIPILERLKAALVFDSRSARPGLGFRGGPAATLLRYEVGDLLIDLAVSEAGDIERRRYSITGQIDGAPDEPITIELRTPDGAVVAVADQAALGSFTLEVDLGTYELVARFGGIELTVPAISIG